MEVLTEKKRRGRKSKVELIDTNTETNIIIDKVPKKRGRKPKGGKVVVCVQDTVDNVHTIPNIILHLKCNKSDIDTADISKFKLANDKIDK